MRHLILPLLLLGLQGCAEADEGSTGPRPDPIEIERATFEPGPDHHPAAHLGRAPDGWEARDGEPLGIGVLRAAEGRPLVLEHTAIHADVTAGLAVVEVAQHFSNPFDHPIDTEYVLPLPPDAGVRAFRLRCGDRVIEGEIHERQRAREIYEEAAAHGQKAALLEQMRENLFTQQVAGICPGESVVVTTEYVQQVPRTDGRMTLAVPTTVGERYDVPVDLKVPAHTPAPTRGGRDVSFTLSIDEGLPVASLWSDSHAIDVWTEDASGLVVTLEDSDTVPNKDISVSWTLAGDAPRAAAVVRPPTGDEDGYVALTLEPAILEDLDRTRPRELFFVLDSSCSMTGNPWDTSVATVRRALEQMDGDDTFNLVIFSGNAVTMWPLPRPATRGNVREAQSWLAQRFMGGGTNLEIGLRTAFETPGDPDADRRLLLLTDGYIGRERELGEAVAAHRGRARVFALGVGSSVNRLLLETVATAGGGAVDYHLAQTPIDDTVDAFYRRIAAPPMTGVTVDWGGLDVYDVTPARIPDPWAGQPVRVVARYRGAGRAQVALDATVEGRPLHLPVELDLDGATAHEAVRTLWARERIDELTWTRPDPVSRAAAVTPLALTHHLVSEFTSLVAVEDRPSTCGPARRQVEVVHYGPAGTRLDQPSPRVPRPAVAPSPSPSPSPRPRPRPAPAHAPPSIAPSPVAAPAPAPEPAADTTPEEPVAARRFVVQTVTATGTLDAAAARTALESVAERLGRCLPSSTGSVRFVLTVEDGAVVALPEAGLTGAALACARSELRGLSLEGTGQLTVTFGFRAR